MSEWISAIILGAIQGLTEFLPISSSGHLALFQQFLPTPSDPLFFDLVLHLGSLVPVLYLYRSAIGEIIRDCLRFSSEYWNQSGVRLAIAVCLGSVPTAVIGLLFEDVISAMFHAPETLAISFAVTGFVLWFTRKLVPGKMALHEFPWWLPLVIGLAQGFAVTPGISRSGSTIAAALYLGVNRELAAKFSFLLSIPAILGAFVLKARKAVLVDSQLGIYIVGALVAAAVGYLALKVLVRLVKQGQFHHFSWYLWTVAVGALALGILQ
ncbi:MAG: undecaprenyl-diphosphate phosphatase [Myxococcota bacterium]